MRRRSSCIKGKWGWLVLAGFVGTWDGFAATGSTQTLSAAFLEAVHHPKHKAWVIILWMYVTLHLFNLLPCKLDPLRSIAIKIGAEKDIVFTIRTTVLPKETK